MRAFFGSILAAAVVLVAGGCGDDNPSGPGGNGNGNGDGNGAALGVTADWQGQWETTVAIAECGSSDTTEFTTTDDLCVGDLITGGQSTPGLNCTGDFNPNSYDYDCSGSVTQEGCTANYVVSMQGQRSGGTFAASGTISVSFSGGGSCAEQQDVCTELQISGTRTGDGNCP